MKREIFQDFSCFKEDIMATHRDSVARILPKPMNTVNTVLNTVNKNTSAKIHFKSLHLKNVLREALAAQMMPPPPPPGPPMGGNGSATLKYVVNNNPNDLIMQEGEVEFYKNDVETGSVSSGGSDDYEDQLNIIAELGKLPFLQFT